MLSKVQRGLDAANCIFYLYTSEKCPKHVKEEAIVSTVLFNLKQTMESLILVLYNSNDVFLEDSWESWITELQ
jgi:hypothetical protein